MTQALISTRLIDANPWQPRMSEDAEHLANLATSIADDGLMQIPSARRIGERVQLAFGHSRLAAYKLLASLQKVELLSEICEPAESESATARAWQAARTAADNLVDFDEMPLNIMDIDDEAMFRFAVSENVQRKDLNAVETARAMKRYKDEFGKSSVEIGALFGVNDATVRGTLRLLDLPQEARNSLAAGEISQGAARVLLSMQKVMPKGVVNAVSRIKATDGKSTPENIVQNMLQQQYDRIVCLTRDVPNDAKPRATRNGWLLDMNNFPNSYLPELTKNDLTSLFPEEGTARFTKRLVNSKNVIDFKLILQESGDIEDADIAEKIEALIEPSTCTTCAYYTRINSEHYCGLKLCFDRKTEAWRKEQLREAGKRLGIEAYTEADGPFCAIECYTSRESKLFDNRHPSLRLIEHGKVKGYPSQYNFKGVNTDIFYVVATGDALEELKEAKRKERAANKAGQNIINSRGSMLQDRKERLLWEVSDQLAGGLFANLSSEAIKALNASAYSWHSDVPKWAALKAKANEFELDAHLRQKIAFNMLKKMMDLSTFYNNCSVLSMAENLIAVGEKAGPRLPKGLFGDLLEMADKMDSEIDERFPVEKKPVSVETAAEVTA